MVAWVASACTALATDRMAATPVVVRPSQTDPKCQARIAAMWRSSSTPCGRLIMNSCPIRWASVIDASVVATQAVVDRVATAGAEDAGTRDRATVAVAPMDAADDGDDAGDGAAVGGDDGAPAHEARVAATSASAARRARAVETVTREETGRGRACDVRSPAFPSLPLGP